MDKVIGQGRKKSLFKTKPQLSLEEDITSRRGGEVRYWEPLELINRYCARFPGFGCSFLLPHHSHPLLPLLPLHN